MEEYETQAPPPRTEVPPLNPEGTQKSAEANTLTAELQNLLQTPHIAMQKLAEEAANKEKPEKPENPLDGPVKITVESTQPLQQQPPPSQQPSLPEKDTIRSMALRGNATFELNKTPHPIGTETAEDVIAQVARGVSLAAEYAVRRKSPQSNNPAQPEKSPTPIPLPSAPEPLAA